MNVLRPISVIVVLLLAMESTLTQKTLAEQDVAPGKSSKARGDVWTLQGELGPSPVRTSDTLPLSDQKNEGEWSIYEPLTDEFSGASLDEKKWLPYHLRWKGRQPAWFSPDNVKIADGHLQLVMKRDDPPPKLRNRGYHTYSSAAVHATGRVKYGYFEVRAKPMDSGALVRFGPPDQTVKSERKLMSLNLAARSKGTSDATT